MAIRIERLTEAHDCKKFRCGENSLEYFLRKHAIVNDDHDLGRTYVAVDVEQGAVVGYYTISTTSVDARSLPDGESLHYPMIGAILIGRLAVAKSRKRQGIGRRLTTHVFKIADEVAERCGAYALVVDALPTKEAISFYEGLGFERLKNTTNDRQIPFFILMRKIRETFDAAKILAARIGLQSPAVENMPPEAPKVPPTA